MTLGNPWTLTVTVVVAVAAALSSAEDSRPASKPIRVVLIGDSTVSSYANPPKDRPDLTGWGQVFGEFFRDRVTVLNHAASGRSTKSFIREGRWEKALAAKPDYVFIQFGHNDSHTTKDGKPVVPAETDFQDYLRQYIDEARASGARPVLVTPVARRTFVAGKIHTALQPYADAMLRVGKMKNVPVIDLHAASMALFSRLGDEGSADLTASASDRTHFSRKGALAMARLVVQAIPAAVPELQPYLKVVATSTCTPVVPGLPVFEHRGVVLDYKGLKYNPCNDVIIPSVIKTDDLRQPRGRFYMYYAPHNAPGGICLAYADAPEGPWKEYDANPLIVRDWPPYYKVSHVSGPHAIWIEEEKKLFVYYHGENDTTRMASTKDGIHFQYDGVAVTTRMFNDISEASYARVFRYTLPGRDNRYIMLLMGNNRGTRRMYLAWSKDGRTWETRRTPLLDPPPGTNQIAQAWYFPWSGRHYLIFHGHLADRFQTANLYAAEIDPAFERPKHLGLFYDHTSASSDNVAQMSPCFLSQGDRIYMYSNIGPRLNQKIALAVAETDLPGPQRHPMRSDTK